VERPRPIDPVLAACSMPLSRRPLVLAPSSQSGWFRGSWLVAADPIEVHEGISHSAARALVEQTFESDQPRMTVAVLPYDGAAQVHTYSGAWRREGATWSRWGRTFDAREVESSGLSLSPLSQPLLRDACAEMNDAQFAHAVERAQESIRSGDIYVLNLTYRVRGVPAGSPGQLFLQLLKDAPAPMAALVGSPRGSLASVSPERFVMATRERDDSVTVTTEPIKGTSPRRSTEAADLASAQSLVESEKERAEHVMIVDLERNDLGRVCETGSVVVDPLFAVFPTPYCHQMVSTVRGSLSASAGIADLVEATFPSGSITGAPKRSAMQHISRFEISPRGAYTGSLIVAMPGRMDSSVVIRTLEFGEGEAVWGTGCGITIDSDPAAEWRESELKCWPVLGR